MPWWGFLASDAGLPSLLHRPLNLLASEWGGVGLLLSVHAACYALLVALLLDLSVRLAGPLAGAAVVIGWATSPPIYEVFAGLRAYPTFLLLVLLNLRVLTMQRRRAC